MAQGKTKRDSSALPEEAAIPATGWYKGNIHTHSNLGVPPDADSDPEIVTSWYRRHGYDFLVLSDHNHRTLLEYRPGKRRFRRPLMIPGEEVTVRIHDGATPIHLGALGIARLVEPIDAGEVVPTLQANVDAIRQAGGIAAINHPNYTWAFDHRAISAVRGARLLEVYNGHPRANLFGSADRPGCEEIWGKVLTSGLPIWGVATDDAHHFAGEFGQERSNPGRGWIVVKAARLDEELILDGIRAGEFYASTGVALDDLDWGPEGIALRIREARDTVYTTRFVGAEETTLQETVGLEATYRPRGGEGYFRAVVTASNGAKAWLQPVFLS